MARDGAVAKRLQSELMSLMMDPAPGVSAFPDGENMLKWMATIEGTSDGYYANMSFSLTLEFSSDYPISAPNVKFVTPIYHPNVDMSGNICLDILKEKWSATYTVTTLLLSIRALLDSPNNDSPLNAEAANLWTAKEQFQTLATKRYNTRTE
eukprot:IDg6703t1